jgi:hypothetical protein
MFEQNGLQSLRKELKAKPKILCFCVDSRRRYMNGNIINTFLKVLEKAIISKCKWGGVQFLGWAATYL